MLEGTCLPVCGHKIRPENRKGRAQPVFEYPLC